MRRLLLIACVGVITAGSVVYVHLQQLASESLAVDRVEKIEVARGSGLSQLALQIQSRGWVKDVWPIRLYARLNRLENIVAGEYQVEPGESFVDLLNHITAGDVVDYQIVFPEGTTFQEWLAKIAQTKALIKSEKLDLSQIDKSLAHPEGWFFPDTYYFHKGDKDIELLKRAYQRTRKILAEEWAARDSNLPYQTAYQALIMASVVEKETGDPAERPDIAGVFVRRLQKGMRLQSDPTVIYGLGEAYQGNITRKHLKQATPYNTYTERGLPPTPIAMPGRGAIYAALHPKPGKALYFVATGDGGHYFSETLAEHNRAVRRYQLNRKANYRSRPNL